MNFNGNTVFVSFSFLILFVGGALFFFFPNWFFIPLFGLIWFLYTFKINGNSKKLKFALATGAFIAIFDFILENAGAQFGYWVSKKSLFFVLAVPIEIITGAFIAGTAWYLLYDSLKWNRKIVLLSIILWSIGGTAGEYYLNFTGFMSYGNGWLSIPHAFVTYFVAFLVFYGFATFVNKKFAKLNS